MSGILKCSLISSHITASQILVPHNVIIIGEGTFLHINDYTTGKYITSYQVFIAASIHGIKTITQDELTIRILVHGQKSIKIVDLDLQSFNWIQVTGEFILEDWLIDVAWEKEIQSNIIVATAHNSLIHINFNHIKGLANEERKGPKSLPSKAIFKKDISTEKCLLYCGRLVVAHEYLDCIFLAGTIFSKLLIWGPMGRQSESKEIFPFHTISGHEGVLFSISYDATQQLITSTSDDRSMIVWSIQKPQLLCSDLVSNEKVNSYITENFPYISNLNINQRTKLNFLFWSGATIIKNSSCYGHSARVWKSVIVKDKIVSVGEDSKICVWNLSGELISQWIGHNGASIWSLSVDNDNEKFLTGGRDGSVKLWSLKALKSAEAKQFNDIPWCEDSDFMKIYNSKNIVNESNIESMNIETLENYSTINKLNTNNKKKLNSVKPDFPRKILLYQKKHCLVITDYGYIWDYDFIDQKWKMSFLDELLRSYAIIEINKSTSEIAIGNLLGTIIILTRGIDYSFEIKCRKKTSFNKILSMNYLTENEILVCHENGALVIYIISNDDITAIEHYSLPSCRQRWVSAASILPTQKGRYLIIGGRCGSIYLYKKQETPIHTLKKIHGSNGVTEIQQYENMLISTGRDGFIRWLTVENDMLKITRVARVGQGSWLAKVLFWRQEMFLVAFHGTNLGIWTLDEQKVFEIKCGGGHRSWDIALNDTLNGDKDDDIILSFLKDGIAFHYRSTFLNNIMPIIKPSFNSQETRCLKPIFSKIRGDLFLSGCEDTTFKLFQIEGNHQFKCLEIIRSHLSSIKCIFEINSSSHSACNIPNQSWIVTGGGRAQIKVWCLSLKEFNQHEIMMDQSLKESKPLNVECSEKAMFMLRSEIKKTWKSKELIVDPETRFMDGTSIWIDDNNALIIMASSDGYLRFMTFCKQKESIDLLGEYEIGPCILRILLHWVHSESPILLVTTTAGKIHILDIKNIYNSLNERKDEFEMGNIRSCGEIVAHQSGVNAFDIYSNENSYEIMIISGGDDNKIAVTKLKFENFENSFSICITCLCEINAHGSQVMGLKWLESDCFFSTSTDQRLFTWKLECPSLKIWKINSIACNFTSIPDVQGLECSYDHKKCQLFVYGNGIQIFQYDK